MQVESKLIGGNTSLTRPRGLKIQCVCVLTATNFPPGDFVKMITWSPSPRFASSILPRSFRSVECWHLTKEATFFKDLSGRCIHPRNSYAYRERDSRNFLNDLRFHVDTRTGAAPGTPPSCLIGSWFLAVAMGSQIMYKRKSSGPKTKPCGKYSEGAFLNTYTKGSMGRAKTALGESAKQLSTAFGKKGSSEILSLIDWE